MLHRTFNAIVISCLLLFSSSGTADYVKPSDTVLAFIVAIQNNNFQGVANNADLIAIATHPRHSYSPDQLIALFKNIDISKISVIDLVGSDFVIKVRASGGINLDFELESIQQKTASNKAYRVIGIHP